MKTIINATFNSFGVVACAGAVLLITSDAQAQNLFVSAGLNGSTITEIAPSGAQSAFASGLSDPRGLAFDSAGNLFVSDGGSGNIYEFTPGGAQSTFASGVNNVFDLAFNSAGDLFTIGTVNGDIYEYTPGGVQSIFASGLSAPFGCAFNSAGNLFVADNNVSGNIYEIYEKFVNIRRAERKASLLPV
jgi:glucose/arabinose dehydrogenase